MKLNYSEIFPYLENQSLCLKVNLHLQYKEFVVYRCVNLKANMSVEFRDRQHTLSNTCLLGEQQSMQISDFLDS